MEGRREIPQGLPMCQGRWALIPVQGIPTGKEGAKKHMRMHTHTHACTHTQAHTLPVSPRSWCDSPGSKPSRAPPRSPDLDG